MKLSILPRGTLRALSIVALLSCTREPNPSAAGPAPETVPSTSSPADHAVSAPTPTTPAPSRSGDPLPPIDDACKVAADCGLYMEPRADNPCCPSCTGHKGASKASLERYRAACGTRFGMCAVSCASVIAHAECKAGHCVAVEEK